MVTPGKHFCNILDGGLVVALIGNGEWVSERANVWCETKEPQQRQSHSPDFGNEMLPCVVENGVIETRLKILRTLGVVNGTCCQSRQSCAITGYLCNDFCIDIRDQAQCLGLKYDEEIYNASFSLSSA